MFTLVHPHSQIQGSMSGASNKYSFEEAFLRLEEFKTSYSHATN